MFGLIAVTDAREVMYVIFKDAQKRDEHIQTTLSKKHALQKEYFAIVSNVMTTFQFTRLKATIHSREKKFVYFQFGCRWYIQPIVRHGIKLTVYRFNCI